MTEVKSLNQRMDDILSMADLQTLVVSGETDWKRYGEVNATYHHDFVLFNYSQLAQFQCRWNWFERNSRGLILNAQTGEIVARPFAKFFNYGEEMPTEDNEIVSITEKMDGSLGILYREEGQYKIATRGSFTSEQAIWATKLINDEFENWKPYQPIPDELTLLFEIIYPENRIVVDYNGFAGLILLAAINRFTGEELSYNHLVGLGRKYGFKVVGFDPFASLADMLEAAKQLTANREGWVVRYANGERYKVKGDAYRIAHKIMTGATFKRVLEAVETGQFDQMIEGVPDEFLSTVRLWKTEIANEVERIKQRCAVVLSYAPQSTQKEFALWIQERFDKEYQSYLFAAKAGKPLEPLIYRKAFENRANSDVPVKADEA